MITKWHLLFKSLEGLMKHMLVSNSFHSWQCSWIPGPSVSSSWGLRLKAGIISVCYHVWLDCWHHCYCRRSWWHLSWPSASSFLGTGDQAMEYTPERTVGSCLQSWWKWLSRCIPPNVEVVSTLCWFQNLKKKKKIPVIPGHSGAGL